jgi:hypothetical protein
LKGTLGNACLRPTTSVLLRCKHRIPDGRRTFAVEAQPSKIELSLPDPVQQFNTGYCDRSQASPHFLSHDSNALG